MCFSHEETKRGTGRRANKAAHIGQQCKQARFSHVYRARVRVRVSSKLVVGITGRMHDGNSECKCPVAWSMHRTPVN